MKNIYTWDLPAVACLIGLSPVIWGFLTSAYRRHKFLLQFVTFILFGGSVFAIAFFCICGRTGSAARCFTVISPYNSEFHRELIMNVFLYVPFGMAVPFLFDSTAKRKVGKTVFLAFFVSLCIEYWQYIQGTGVAQVSDLVMNTLGAEIGALAFPISKCFAKTWWKHDVQPTTDS